MATQAEQGQILSSPASAGLTFTAVPTLRCRGWLGYGYPSRAGADSFFASCWIDIYRGPLPFGVGDGLDMAIQAEQGQILSSPASCWIDISVPTLRCRGWLGYGYPSRAGADSFFTRSCSIDKSSILFTEVIYDSHLYTSTRLSFTLGDTSTARNLLATHPLASLLRIQPNALEEPDRRGKAACASIGYKHHSYSFWSCSPLYCLPSQLPPQSFGQRGVQYR